MFDSLIDAFDFNPFEPGNPMTLGMFEENEYSNFVNCDNTDDEDEDNEW